MNPQATRPGSLAASMQAPYARRDRLMASAMHRIFDRQTPCLFQRGEPWREQRKRCACVAVSDGQYNVTLRHASSEGRCRGKPLALAQERRDGDAITAECDGPRAEYRCREFSALSQPCWRQQQA